MDTNIFLFADDARLYEHESILNLQGRIDKFVEWADEWLVKINYGKCKVMALSHQRNPDKSNITYTMKGKCVRKCQYF